MALTVGSREKGEKGSGRKSGERVVFLYPTIDDDVSVEKEGKELNH